MELIAVNGRLRYEQAGNEILWQQAVCDPVFDGYMILEAPGNFIKSNLERALWHVADQFAASLMGQPAQICSGDDALRTLETLNTITENL